MSKIHTLMKIKFSTHANWEKWRSKLLEVMQGCAGVLPLWHFAEECLFSEHKIRPPPRVRACVETKLTSDNMTKEKLKIWKMVKVRLTKDPMQPVQRRCYKLQPRAHFQMNCSTSLLFSPALQPRQTVQTCTSGLGAGSGSSTAQNCPAW